MDGGTRALFSQQVRLPGVQLSLPELEPRLFSFNSPVGRLPGLRRPRPGDGVRCRARGRASRSLSLASGAVKGWDRRNAYTFSLLESVAKHYGFDLEHAVRGAARDGARGAAARLGRRGDRVRLRGRGRQRQPRSVQRAHPFEGILPNLERRLRETDSAAVREDLARSRRRKPCPDCHGTRLRTRGAPRLSAARRRRQAGEPIFEVEHVDAGRGLAYFDGSQLAGAKAEIADKIVREIARGCAS